MLTPIIKKFDCYNTYLQGRDDELVVVQNKNDILALYALKYIIIRGMSFPLGFFLEKELRSKC